MLLQVPTTCTRKVLGAVATATAALHAQVAALDAKLEATLKGDTKKPEPSRGSAARKPHARSEGQTEEQKLGTEAAAYAAQPPPRVAAPPPIAPPFGGR